MFPGQIAQTLEETIDREQDSAVLEDRLHDDTGDLTRVGLEDPGDHLEVVEGGHQGEADDGIGDSGTGRHARGLLGRTEVFLVPNRNHHRVVVAVVGPLELDDQVASGHRSHQMDGIHGCLGARVSESPKRQAVTHGQLLGDDDGVGGRLCEMGPFAHPLAHRGNDRRVGMPGEHRPVSTVHVDVFVAIDVPNPGSEAAVDPDRLGPRDLPTGGDSAGERLPCHRVQTGRLGGSLQEFPLFCIDQTVQHPGHPIIGGEHESPSFRYPDSPFRIDCGTGTRRRDCVDTCPVAPGRRAQCVA